MSNSSWSPSRPFSSTLFNPITKLSSFKSLLIAISASIVVLAAVASVSASTLVVSSANLQGWATQTGTCGGSNTSAAQFMSGPATAPAGIGSFRMTIGSDGDSYYIYRNPAFDGVLTSQLTSLTYSTYVTTYVDSQAIALNLRIDTDGDNIPDDTLWFEPAYQDATYFPSNPQATLTLGTWQTWNAYAGGWYTDNGAAGSGPGTAVKSLATILAALPAGTKIAPNGSLGGLRLYSGCGAGSWDNFNGNVDNLTVGVSAVNTTYDFEPTVVVVDDDGMASETDCNDSAPAYLTIQSAINAAPVGYTIKVCPGTYSENLTLSKKLTINGARAGVDARGRVVGAPNPAVESIITTANPLSLLDLNTGSADSIIDGFTFSGGGNAGTQGAIRSSTGTVDRVQILNNHMVGFKDAAIWLNRTGVDMTISRNVMDGALMTTGSQIIFFNTQSFNGLNLVDNWIKNGGSARAGVFADGDHTLSESTTRPVLVSGNLFDADSVGVNFGTRSLGKQATPVTGTYAAIVSNNTFSNSTFDGYQGSIQHGLISGNTFSNNGRHGLALTSFGNLGADRGAQNSKIIGNLMIGNGFAMAGSGLFISVQGAGLQATNQSNFNRIVGNATGVSYSGADLINVENNWWGCNYGPGVAGAGCTGTNGKGGTSPANLDADPWLTLTTAASPAFVPVGGGSAVTSKLTINSALADTSGSGNVPNGTPASFVGTLGSVAPPSSTTTSGVTGTLFTAGGTPGVGGVATTIDGQTVNASITVLSVCADVSIPNAQSLTGVPVTIPVNTTEMTSRGAISADFTITYNSAVLTPSATPTFGVALGSVGNSNGGGRVLTVSNPSPGTLVISIFGTLEMQGSGPLVNMTFDVIGLPATSSPLNFGSPTFRYNEGTPCSNLTNGSLTVTSGTISGTVSYGNVVGLPAAPRHVPNTTLNAAGSIPQSTVTALNGTYSLSGMGSGPYTVTPSKTGGDFSALSGLDSAYIAQYVVGIAPGNGINATQQIVADVSGAGGISSFDAALIARYVALLPGSGASGTWRFVPVNRMYPNVNTNQTGQDYDALLMGDVTGNWVDPSATRLGQPMMIIPTEKPVSVTAGQVTASYGSDFTVPVTISSTKGKGIVAYQFDLRYNPDVLRAQPMPVDLAGAISNGMTITVNSETPGLLKVVIFGALPINGEGVLLNLKFTAIGKTGATSVISFQSLMLNEGMPFSLSTDGRVDVSAPTAKEATVSGRLMSPDGQGVANVIVKLTNTQGESHTTLTNELGDYRFGGVKVGQSYTVSVESGRFTFSPQTISVESDQVNINLFARP